MSIDAISGLNSGTVTPVGSNATGTSGTGTLAPAAQTQATATSQGTPQPKAAPKPPEPFVLVPTEPLTPKVLAELIGRQLTLNGSGGP